MLGPSLRAATTEKKNICSCLYSPHVCLCWMVCPSSRGSSLSPLSPACEWMVCPPSEGLVCLCLPSPLSHVPVFGVCLPSGGSCPVVSPCLSLSLFICACLAWFFPPFRESCLLLSPCLPLSPYLPLSRIVSPHVRLCWTVREKKGKEGALSPLKSQ